MLTVDFLKSYYWERFLNMFLFNYLKELNWKRIETTRKIRYNLYKKIYKPKRKIVSRKELKACKNVLIWGGGGIGDAIVISSLVEVLCQNGLKISIIASERIFFCIERWMFSAIYL